MLETFRGVCSTANGLEMPIEALEDVEIKYKTEELIFIELGNRLYNTSRLLNKNRGLELENRGLELENRGLALENRELELENRGLALNSNQALENRELTVESNQALENRELLALNSNQALESNQVAEKFIWSKDELSVEMNLAYKIFQRQIARLGLMYGIPNIRRIQLKKPRLFEGCFEIKSSNPTKKGTSSSSHNTQSTIETSKPEVTLDLVDRKFRYCAIKPSRTIQIPIHTFCISGQVSCKNDLRICYKRKIENFLEQLALSCRDCGVESAQSILTLLRIDPSVFVQKRIELFLARRISSSAIIKDLAFLSKIGSIEIDLHRMVLYLENTIYTFRGDRFSYELYRLVGFLVLVKKVKILPMCTFNYTRNQKYQVIMHPPGFPKNYTNRLDGNITRIFEKQRKKAIGEIYSKLFYLKRIGMTIEEKFLKKVFSAEDTGLFAILELKLSEQVQHLGSKQKSLLKLFAADLNEFLKKGKNSDELYELLGKELDLITGEKAKSMIDYIFDKITLVHENRIRSSTDINVLKAVYGSMMKCEKVFGLRNREVELRLKKQVNRLLY